MSLAANIGCHLAVARRLLVTVMLAVAINAPPIAGADEAEPRVVSRSDILEAMRQEQQRGYDPSATTNAARFQAAVILQLVRWAREREPDRTSLLIQHEDFFRAFVEMTGLARERMPLYLRVPHEHRQDQWMQYGSDAAIYETSDGPLPLLVVNVKASWPEVANLPNSFSYEDTHSTPHLKITNRRVITYRLVEYSDMLVYDEITGVFGRPTSGALGLLFNIIGEGRVLQARLAISADGLQVVSTKARKWLITLNPIATVYPDGRTVKGLPQDRQDLAAIETRIRRPLNIQYTPFPD